jgi:hypothetical protein
VGGQRRQAHLHALDVAPAPANAAGRQTGRDAASVPLAAGIVDDYPVTEVEDQRHGGVRHYLKVNEVVRSIAEEVSPVEAVEGYLERMDELDPSQP